MAAVLPQKRPNDLLHLSVRNVLLTIKRSTTDYIIASWHLKVTEGEICGKTSCLDWKIRIMMASASIEPPQDLAVRENEHPFRANYWGGLEKLSFPVQMR
jgi:hypothetical protein